MLATFFYHTDNRKAGQLTHARVLAGLMSHTCLSGCPVTTLVSYPFPTLRSLFGTDFDDFGRFTAPEAPGVLPQHLIAPPDTLVFYHT